MRVAYELVPSQFFFPGKSNYCSKCIEIFYNGEGTNLQPFVKMLTFSCVIVPQNVLQLPLMPLGRVCLLNFRLVVVMTLDFVTLSESSLGLGFFSDDVP
jgi:hypothetical protein